MNTHLADSIFIPETTLNEFWTLPLLHPLGICFSCVRSEPWLRLQDSHHIVMFYNSAFSSEISLPLVVEDMCFSS